MLGLGPCRAPGRWHALLPAKSLTAARPVSGLQAAVRPARRSAVVCQAAPQEQVAQPRRAALALIAAAGPFFRGCSGVGGGQRAATRPRGLHWCWLGGRWGNPLQSLGLWSLAFDFWPLSCSSYTQLGLTSPSTHLCFQ